MATAEVRHHKVPVMNISQCLLGGCKIEKFKTVSERAGVSNGPCRSSVSKWLQKAKSANQRLLSAATGSGFAIEQVCETHGGGIK